MTSRKYVCFIRRDLRYIVAKGHNKLSVDVSFNNVVFEKEVRADLVFKNNIIEWQIHRKYTMSLGIDVNCRF